MRSGPPLETNPNDLLTDHRREHWTRRLIRAVFISLLATTGFIHWYLPVVHPMDMPGELTGGIIVIPHELLHLLFDVNGAGYFVLIALVAGWLSLWANHPQWICALAAGYAALTIIAWILLSDPAERGALDYLDKAVELSIIALAVWLLLAGKSTRAR